MSHPPIDSETFPYGILCGCDCGCARPLNDGNAMQEDVTNDAAKPWEAADGDEPRIELSICAQCFVGEHIPRARR